MDTGVLNQEVLIWFLNIASLGKILHMPVLHACQTISFGRLLVEKGAVRMAFYGALVNC